MTPTGDAVAEAAARLAPLGRRVARDAPLGVRTTYRVGGPAALLVEVDDGAQLAVVAAAVKASGIEVVVVGKGSNLLVADGGFDGLAVVLGEGLAAVAIDETVVRAGGAAAMPVVARRTAAAGLGGFEWAVGIPGSVGGAVRMNAGGHGADMAATLVGVRVVDLRCGEDGWVPADTLELGYRHSRLRSTEVVVEAELALAPRPRAEAEALIADIVRWRRANQPGGQNAGSVFTNPPDDAAGRLVDVAGAKGLRLRTAQVSPKHANFIVADPGGRAADVYDLMVEVRRRVLDRTGVALVPETHLVGFGPEAVGRGAP